MKWLPTIEYWMVRESDWRAGDPSLHNCAIEIAACGRRLAKGRLRDEERRLPLLAAQALNLAANGKWESVPTELIGDWILLWQQAARPDDSSPPFLPLLFAPAEAAGKHGSELVTTQAHLQWLVSAGESPAIRARRELFRRAIEQKCGIVERVRAFGRSIQE